MKRRAPQYLLALLLCLSVGAQAKKLPELEVLEGKKSDMPVVRVNLPARKLTLFDKGVEVKTYPIAVSQLAFAVQMGKREISRIVWNPWWYPPQNREWSKDEIVTPPGPKNPMGPVKMDIGKRYYIHGTNEEFSVGRPATHGCVRLKNKDAREVASWLQKRFSTKFKEASFEKAMAKNQDNLIVELNKPVPVQFIYDLVEIKDKTLFVYADIYMKEKARLLLIEEELTKHGYDLSKLRRKTLEWQLKKVGAHDLRVSLSTILTSTKKN
jgi:murein L,D-transpeptidase YcbB/YkuD